jgi:S-formylglutathione hydrolase
MRLLKEHKTFGGRTAFWAHDSATTGTSMRLATFEPATRPIKRAIIWLSGLTCTEENFITKSGIQRILADTDTMVLAPDTSPRGLSLPGEHDTYDFGSGAGFYVDAVTPPYDSHYRMFTYVVEDIWRITQAHFGVSDLSLMGHSMGGHGALVIGLRHPERFSQITSFAPIAHPSVVPWGIKAFQGYLGNSDWGAYDACELLRRGYRHPAPLRIYQGSADEFLATQLRPQDLVEAAREAGQPCQLNLSEGYDHSYYFIASFLADAVASLAR